MLFVCYYKEKLLNNGIWNEYKYIGFFRIGQSNAKIMKLSFRSFIYNYYLVHTVNAQLVPIHGTLKVPIHLTKTAVVVA